MAGKGGGAWKVAYADFVTAMMAFFLVMWIVAQNKPVKEAVAGYFRDPYGSGSKPSGTGIMSGKSAPAPGIKASIKVATRGGKVKSPVDAASAAASNPAEVEGRKRGLMVLHDGDNSSVGITVTFAEDSAELDDRGIERLKLLAPKLLGKPNKIEIRGHSTGRPLPPESPYQDAWQLSYARCLVTMQFLEENGVEPDRFRLSQAGASEPQTLGAGSDAHAQNSRVEVFMLGEYSNRFKGTRKERDARFDDSNSPLPQARVLDAEVDGDHLD